MSDVAPAKKEFRTYDEFFAYYLTQHSHPVNRAFHYFGTVSAVSFFIGCLASGHWKFSLLAVVIGYGCAWIGHFGFEGNKPATFGHPGWSFISDFRMLFLFATGRLGPALKAALPPGDETA
mgnify:CR=1 FL=1